MKVLSVEKQIIKAISNHRRGKIFFPKDFFKFGSSTAVRQALKRIEDKGLLVRVAQGIYLYPKTHKILGILRPSIDEIAIAISKRDKARVIPTGVQALNKLGLSTQVPMKVVYITDGTPRIITINKGSIKFKIASPKTLAVKSEANALIIQALREIGKENVDAKILKRIYEVLETVDIEMIKHDAKLAPVWIGEIMKDSLKS